MADVLVKKFTYETDVRLDDDTFERLYTKVYGDRTFIREVSDLIETVAEEVAFARLKKSIEESGITAKDGTHYKLDASAKSSTRAEVKEQWSKYNQDKTSNIAFGEGISPNAGFAGQLAMDNAIYEFGKKQNTKSYTVKGARITDQKNYTDNKGMYFSLALVEVDAIIPDKAVVEQDTGGNSATLDDAEATVITGTSEANPDAEFSEYFSSSRTARAKAIKNGKTYIAGAFRFYTKDTEVLQKDIWRQIYEDIAEKIYKDDEKKDETLEDKYTSGYTIKTTSFKFTTVPPDRPKDKPKPPPPPPATPAPPPAAVKKTPVVYQPKTRVTKPKSTNGGEYVEKISGKDYKGPYIQAYKNKYYAGSNLDQNGVELIPAGTKGETIITPALALLFSSIQGYFNKKVSIGDKVKGLTKRFFMQSKINNKIVELDKSNYQQAQAILPSQNFAEVDWVIKGPAEDKNFNGYLFEGAESKNKKAIQAIEKQIPGITTFIKDYKFLVEEPVIPEKPITSQEIVIKDLETRIENDRKANFDHKR